MSGEELARRFILRIRNDSDVPRAVLAATDFSKAMGFSPTESHSLGTVVSELATNILKYAKHGSVTFQEISAAKGRGLQITVVDRGPGIENVRQALQDHYSSSGTLGLGLPGVRRMVDDFDIESTVGVGTKVLIRKWLVPTGQARGRSFSLDETTGSAALAERGTRRGRHSFPSAVFPDACLEVAHVNRPCRGELVSGDAVSVTEVKDGVLIGVVDGLGHGRAANMAAKAATRFLQKGGSPDLVHVMKQLHDILQDTVGAAVSLCWIDLATGSIEYAAIGNTVLRIHGARWSRLSAAPGTVGEKIKGVRVQAAQLHPRDVLIIHTDGISDRTEFDDDPRLLSQGVSMVAERLVAEYGKGHDDATVVVCRLIK